ncbi:MAG: class I SAM-dependent methyltransferase [Woeseia sp.]|nr:class I SAM-dependent methyltransferase [Woeseia sp.]
MTSKRISFLSLAAFSLVLIGCGQAADEAEKVAVTPGVEVPVASKPGLAALLANDSRAAEDRDRDAARKQTDVIGFLGITPGMSVIDVIAAGGYYTEVLSLAVGSEGHVVAQNPAMVLQFSDGANEKAISARLAGDRLPNVSRLNIELTELTGSDTQYDAAITALNYHDIYNGFGEKAAVGALKVAFNSLKPGGVFGIIDHEGVAGNDNEAMHRGVNADAVRVAEAAGFIVEGDSDILQLHDDDMSLPVFDAAVRGKTNRFLLKLRKPSE